MTSVLRSKAIRPATSLGSYQARVILSEQTDEQIKDLLIEIDNEESIDVTKWEAEFINDVAFSDYRLSVKQRDAALRIIDKYL